MILGEDRVNYQRLAHKFVVMIPGFVTLLLGVAGCVTSNPNVSAGMQPGYLGFVPARIGILSCLPWPKSLTPSNEQPSNAEIADIESLCRGLDGFVLEGFSQQPFMKGYSPKVTEKGLRESGFERANDVLASLKPNEQIKGESIGTIYTRTVTKDTNWQEWLIKVSSVVRASDALLLPIVTRVENRDINDRGLYIKERSAEAVLLLVDTNRGDLVWYGRREARMSRKALRSEEAKNLSYPSWNEIAERLFQNDLWRDFPGRQVF